MRTATQDGWWDDTATWGGSAPPAADETTAPFAEGHKLNDIRTVTEGLSEILPDGEIFVEETNYGRLLKMNKAGDISWQYINCAADGRNYVVNWSRYIDAELAEEIAARAKQNCAG